VTPTRPVLVCEGVEYVYSDGTRANEGIDLALHRGELFCLLGPNGAGKTTLIRQITTELRPTAGRVLLDGRDAHADPIATKRRMGVIPQVASLYDGLSVEEHLLYFGPLKGMTRAATRAAAEPLLRECELDGLRHKAARDLSGGEQRKVLVALSLLSDPDLLVLDEPTVGLDPSARRQLWATIEGQKAAGKTVLLTTHYMEEAERLADRIGLIDQGRLAHAGTLNDLYLALGKSFRVTRLHPETGAMLSQHYFDDLAEAQRFVQEKGFQAYAVGRVSLEDIYLRLTGHALEEEPSR